MEVIIVYMMFLDWESVRKVIREFLERKLIVCVNFREYEVMYWWEGKIEEGKEVGVIYKIEVSKWKELREMIKEFYFYDVLMIVRIDFDKFNCEYFEWMVRVFFG